MNKSIYLFIGGSLFGVIAALAIVKSTTDPEQAVVAIPTDTSNIKVRTVKMQVEAMQNGEVEESPSDMQVRLSQQPGTQGMMDMQNNAQTEMATTKEAITPEKNMASPQQQHVAKAPVIPPNDVQITQYNDMDQIISSAANNPNIKLVDLIRQSDSLTIEQRNILTQKTLDMLSRGELTVEQFANK